MTREQLELAKTLWEQARTAAEHAHQTWYLLMQSQKTLIDSMRAAGYPFSVASEQFEHFMEEHKKSYSAAGKHMDQMAAEYEKALDDFEKQNQAKR